MVGIFYLPSSESHDTMYQTNPGHPNNMKKSVTSPINSVKHGRYSKHVQQFMQRHGIKDFELPSTGSFARDMAFKLAIWEEKQEAMKTAIEILRSHDSRALNMFNMLIEVNMTLAKHEHRMREQNKGDLLLHDPDYLNWMKLKLDILKHFEKMKFDLEKIKIEKKVREIKK